MAHCFCGFENQRVHLEPGNLGLHFCVERTTRENSSTQVRESAIQKFVEPSNNDSNELL
jgi:hypothetical protein